VIDVALVGDVDGAEDLVCGGINRVERLAGGGLDEIVVDEQSLRASVQKWDGRRYGACGHVMPPFGSGLSIQSISAGP
jgi:hypothetical protein